MVHGKTLSAIMLTRNSASTVRQALQSLDRTVFDDVIVVDTGSTDDTVSLAEACGADVWCYAWEDNFAEPLNFALSVAKGDWIFRLDSDEELRPESYAVLADLVLQKPASYLAHIHSTINRNGSLTELESTMVRFFPRASAVVYSGAIHENIAIQPIGVRDSGIAITHHGYTDPHIERAKQYRNMAILERELEKSPDSPMLHHYMGITYHVLGQHRKAVEEFRLALDLSRDYVNRTKQVPEYLHSTHHSLCSSLLSLGLWQEALDVANGALKLDPHSSEAYLSKGFALMKLGRLNEAEYCAQKAIDHKDNHPLAVSDRSASGWKAEALLADIKHLRKSEVVDEVIASLKRSGTLAACTQEKGVINGPVPLFG